jgi:choline transporter-like protein 2/4/5
MGCCGKKDVEEEVGFTLERKCTDCFFLLLFLVFWIGMGVVAYLGVIHGQPAKLLYGTDYKDRVCGDDTMLDKKLIYYPRLTDDILDGGGDLKNIKLNGVCVKECPSAGDSISMGSDNYVVPMDTEPTFFRCMFVRDVETELNEECAEAKSGADPLTLEADDPDCIAKNVITIVKSKELSQPNPLAEQMATYGAMIGRWVGDLQESWPVILGIGVGGAVLMGFVWLMLLKYFAGCFVWLTIYAVLISLICGTLFCYAKAGMLSAESLNLDVEMSTNSTGTLTTEQQQAIDALVPPELDADSENTNTFKYTAYVMTAISGVMLVVIVAMRKKIKIAIGIIHEASTCVQRLPWLVTYPLVSVVLVTILSMYFVIVGAYIKTSDAIKTNKFESTVDEPINDYLLAYHFFGFLWTNQVIQAIGMCTVAGAVCHWYWAEDKKKLPRTTVLRSWWRAVRYHIGSLIFGALIVAIVQFIRAVLYYIDRQTKGLQDKNRVLRMIFKCVQCCMWFFEKVLKFISRNAYIVIALHGWGFCKSTRAALAFIMGHIAQVGIVNVIAAFLITLGKVAIFTTCGGVSYLVLGAMYDGTDEQLTSMAVPVGFTVLLSFFVATAFLSVYAMAIDTILLCFCEDNEKNNGEDKPYLMSDGLLKIVNKSAAKARRQQMRKASTKKVGGSKVAPMSKGGALL